ncbi:putative Enoyl reductase (ER) domain-containing protein [Seiridium cardinale]|uniref:Enoyl reductase (ER) domain-containing protein n=1 Tax=Seiridium cardinale TaxID=138064 RepID=A0ABR2XFX9_9PEZI
MVENRAFIYKAIPVGWPEPGKHLEVQSFPFDLEATPPKDGLVTQNVYATFDPSQRGRMRESAINSYSAPMEPGTAVIAVHVISKVLKSDTERFQPGDLLMIDLWSTEEYSILPAEAANRARLLTEVPGVPITAYLGALGMTGLTAYGSLMEIGKPKKGETILVSAAAGAVGQIVGQLAVKEGLTVIGSVGDDAKLDFITQKLGFHSGFNYKKEKPTDALKRLAPNGIDIYYDNVGGELLDVAIAHLRDFGRIVACGAVSQYNAESGNKYKLENYTSIPRKRIFWQGFIVIDENIKKHAGDRDRKFREWIASGELVSTDYITKGIQNAVDGFLGMLSGANLGKSILQISEV